MSDTGRSSSPTTSLPWVRTAADLPWPSTRRRPELWTIDGHELVVHARSCLKLRKEAVEMMSPDRVLLLWSWPDGDPERSRVYAFSHAELHEAWGHHMSQPCFDRERHFSFTTEQRKFDPYIVRRL